MIESERIRVRPWRFEEAPRVLDILSRLEVIKWLGDDPPIPMRNLEEARLRIDGWHAIGDSDPRLGMWAIEIKETGAVAGSVMINELPNAEAREVEIGWHLHPDSQGHGYASEAAGLVLDRALVDGIPEVFALTHTTNFASQAVCKRLGMTDLGVVEGLLVRR